MKFIIQMFDVKTQQLQYLKTFNTVEDSICLVICNTKDDALVFTATEAAQQTLEHLINLFDCMEVSAYNQIELVSL